MSHEGWRRMLHLFCQHRRWHRDSAGPTLQFGENLYVCLQCGKRKVFKSPNQPINYPLPGTPVAR